VKISTVLFSILTFFSFITFTIPSEASPKKVPKVWNGKVPQCPQAVRFFRFNPSQSNENNYEEAKKASEYFEINKNDYFIQELGLCFYSVYTADHRREPEYYGLPPQGYVFLVLAPENKSFLDGVTLETPKPGQDASSVDYYNYGVCATFNHSLKRYQLSLPTTKLKFGYGYGSSPNPCKSPADF
jgi:hypothetical protein